MNSNKNASLSFNKFLHIFQHDFEIAFPMKGRKQNKETNSLKISSRKLKTLHKLSATNDTSMNKYYKQYKQATNNKG